MGILIMQFYVFVLLTCVAQVCNSSPARRELQLPKINVSSPGEINDLSGNETSNIKSSIDIEDTIKEVEHLIKGNPSLPRLTRGEILDIIENITKTDQAKLNKTKSRDQKAVMLVMPYSPDNAQNGDVQALYTKPPVTHLVGDPQKKDEYKRRKIPTRKPPSIIEQLRTKTTQKLKVRTTTKTTQRPFIIRETFKNDITTSTEISVHENAPTHQRYTPEPITKKPTTTTILPFRPLRRRTTTKAPQTAKFSNHKYPEEEVFTVQSTSVRHDEVSTKKPATKPPKTSVPVKSNQGINIINPPKFHVKPQPQYNPPTKTENQWSVTEKPAHRITQPTAPSVIIPENMQLPDGFKDVLKNLDVLLKQDPTYNNYDPLISLPSKQYAVIKESNKNVVVPTRTYQVPQKIATTSTPEFQNIANNLTPDMKDLLMSFGLIPDPNKKEVTTKRSPIMRPSSEVKAESYSSFKPLPDAYGGNAEEGMDELLAKFGLGARANRAQKSMSSSKPQNDVSKSTVNLDVIPDNLKNVLKDIGITYKDVKQLNDEKLRKGEKHVFNPVDLQSATKDDLTRLNQVVGVIKQLEKLNGSVTDEDLKHIDLAGLKQLVGSLNVPLDAQTGPDPLDYDKSVSKNEVKRQQTTTTTTTTAPASSTEARNPSLADLEDSFGGSAVAAVEVATTTTQAPSKSGFYYLVDWNSFFDIDNQKGKRVNLRFQPTVGDPKRFFSVTVP